MTEPELVLGRDGKRYPFHRRTAADRQRLATLTHKLRCGRTLSIKTLQETLAAEFGVRRSIGAISKDLRDFRCPLCRPKPASVVPPPPAPPRRVRAEAFDWR
jgi:hypothetical protein